jgi:hypothetical protein
MLALVKRGPASDKAPIARQLDRPQAQHFGAGIAPLAPLRDQAREHHVSGQGQPLQHRCTGNRWFDKKAGVGGVGAIDLQMHLTGEDFAAACQPSGGIFEKDKVMGGNGHLTYCASVANFD